MASVCSDGGAKYRTDLEFRVILALCRYGAVRCPSEVLALKWGDVRHDEGKLIVRSPKTEAYT